jgi:hypothetical protein
MPVCLAREVGACAHRVRVYRLSRSPDAPSARIVPHTIGGTWGRGPARTGGGPRACSRGRPRAERPLFPRGPGGEPAEALEAAARRSVHPGQAPRRDGWPRPARVHLGGCHGPGPVGGWPAHRVGLRAPLDGCVESGTYQYHCWVRQRRTPLVTIPLAPSGCHARTGHGIMGHTGASWSQRNNATPRITSSPAGRISGKGELQASSGGLGDATSVAPSTAIAWHDKSLFSRSCAASALPLSCGVAVVVSTFIALAFC